ncbi:MAG TPA: hypothetical protein VHO27_14840, partial [Angustibacter sp.]|nr:hypothetical protein [Angustibacter sp.]
HEAGAWADRLALLLRDPERRAALAAGAVEHAGEYGWDATVDGLLGAYRAARIGHARRVASGDALGGDSVAVAVGS